ncbi:hypothetical protein [Shewanella sp. FeAMO]
MNTEIERLDRLCLGLCMAIVNTGKGSTVVGYRPALAAFYIRHIARINTSLCMDSLPSNALVMIDAIQHASRAETALACVERDGLADAAIRAYSAGGVSLPAWSAVETEVVTWVGTGAAPAGGKLILVLIEIAEAGRHCPFKDGEDCVNHFLGDGVLFAGGDVNQVNRSRTDWRYATAD